MNNEYLRDALDAVYQLTEQQEILKLCTELHEQCFVETPTHKRIKLLLDNYISSADCLLDVLDYALKQLEDGEQKFPSPAETRMVILHKLHKLSGTYALESRHHG